MKCRWICLLILLNCSPLWAQPGEELFVRRIEPLLQAKCVACHGGDAKELQGGLSLLTSQSLREGGESQQPLIVPGKPAESPLMLAVLRQHERWSPMPPKEADQLNAQQIGWLREWIELSAPWPSEQRITLLREQHAAQWHREDGQAVSTSGGLSKSWNERRYAIDSLWAYRPVVKPSTDHGGSAALDQLVERSLPGDMTLAPPASAHQFLRRATFDLTGLPPSEEALSEFEVAYARNADWAVQQLIDRLLDSPHYGERMAQHWLDVVRYADSSGFSNDYERGTAWRYRDYVVRAFHSDKAFDRFIEEQLAGDEIDANNPELLIATGFLRMGPWELTGMEVAKIARQRFLDDVTNSIGETFLAHSLQCARCHDHKFDPIPTRDYYALQAIFASTQLVDRPAAFLPDENVAGFDEVKYLRQTRAEHQATLERLDGKSLAAASEWFAQHQIDDSKWLAALRQVQQDGQPKRRGIFAAARAMMLRDGVPEDQYPPRMLGWTPTEIGMERIANKGLERLEWQLDRYEPIAMSVMHGPTPEVTSVNAPMRMAQIRKSKSPIDGAHILLGGDPFSQGDAVTPGVLTALVALAKNESIANAPQINSGPNGASWSHAIPSTLTGRRLALARWINHPSNPLTTRAIVNRLWLWHFGQAIAGNPNNFGSTGQRPTHPELLDWLAATLVENKWSIKAMHRLIMNSAAYRRASSLDKSEGDREQLEKHYAVFKPRRLTAEEIRDSMLAVTGELNRAVGGIPNRPEINPEAALQPRQVMGTFAAAWVASPLPAQRHRRSLYALKLRGLVDPDLEVFNAPTSDFSCERRDVSTVTTQAFNLMNGQSTNLRAVALANRLLQMQLDPAKTIKQLWMLSLGRQPTEREVQLGLEHWRQATSRASKHVIARVAVPLSIERAAIEENTGERFTYTETLYSNRDFVPDVRWADVDDRTRGLAELCLVLLNSNEFLYVY